MLISLMSISLQELLTAMNSPDVLLRMDGRVGCLHTTLLNLVIKKEVILSIVFFQRHYVESVQKYHV